jgi:methylation protein EvaC
MDENNRVPMQLKSCRVCMSPNLYSIFSIADIALAGDFKEDQNQIDQKFPLVLLFCSNCRVIQIDQTIDLNRLFNTYSFSSSTIPSLVEHFNGYAKWLEDRVNPKSVLEVGCNDGILLKPLSERDIKVFGVDMSTNIGELAREKGFDVKSIKFGLEQIEPLKAWLTSVDLITASNAFPHNDDPNGFLQTARKLLAPEGTLALEVMYAGSLKQELQWDTIYHEHLHIHSLTSLKFLLEQNGFYLTSAEIIPMHAGSLRITASLKNEGMDESCSRILENEEALGLNTIESWLQFEQDCYQSIENCKKELIEISRHSRIWAYGASGRASMWLNAAGLDFIEKIVDASILRAGRFMPGMSTPIVFPQEFDESQPEFTLITAWNYAERIMSQHPNYKGKWIVPLPEFRVLNP